MKLAGKTALITGAAPGIGLEFARAYIAQGARVALADINAQAVAQAAESLGPQALGVQMDVTQADSIEAGFAQAIDKMGKLDILINNAALFSAAPIVDITRTDYDRLFAVNVAGTLFCLQAAARHMIARGDGGKIINMASQAGRRGEGLVAVYCATKAGLDHFSRSAALDEALLANPAQIVSIAPGVIDTDMQTDLRTGNPTGFPDQNNFIQLKQSGSLTSPADAAARLLAFLARGDFGSNVVADVRD